MAKEKLPFSKLLAYSCGMMGWSIMTNLIGVMLIYFYLPPNTSGLGNLISQTMIFGVLNLPTVITGAGRLIDAFYDPFIGQFSDRSSNPQGRRIPIMKWFIVPAVVFCALIFYPRTSGESFSNALWLTCMLILFFISATSYIIPYNAMMPELAHTPGDKINYSTFQQVGFVLGIIIAASVNNLAKGMEGLLHLTEKITSIQCAVWTLCILGGIFMAVPVMAIDERRYCTGKPAHTPILQAIKRSITIKNFRYYVVADLSWYMALYIITSGLLYFVTVLCGLKEEEGVYLMGVMVLASLLFYPVIASLARRFGKKRIMLVSFFVLGIVFLCVYFLGKFPASPRIQIYGLVLLASFPLASLGILPPAILAEIAEKDAIDSGENREGLFFAVKYFMVKLGQTFGIALFAFLTLYGKDAGNDLGLRLNGICGFALCAVAMAVFSRFREK